ncbi:reticulon-2 isoform X4 [Python bivittatus]|uniref:Reticulon n=2 Tax=Python bivittatus TaxID=176946 RepID=A0A9F2QYK3_PYTBI|nr:reticulon-2 isoform X4 [Python bivittatus]
MAPFLSSFLAEESPSTASTTPDSTDGANEESDFPELQTAREFSEEEEEGSVEWGTPRELTFSYITIATPSGSSPNLADQGHRGRRDSQTRRTRASLPRTETCETFVPTLGDSLENIPSLCPSPEGEVASSSGSGHELDAFLLDWDAHVGCGRELDAAKGEEHATRCPVPPSLAAEAEGGSSTACSGTDNAREDLSLPAALVSQSEAGTSCGADTPQDRALTSAEFCQPPPPEEEEQEEGPGQEPHSEQLHVEPDQSEHILERNGIVADLVYWRDTRRSALVFTALMVALLCLLHFSIVSVASYLSLAALSITIALRGYSKALQLIRRGDGHHPFQAQLDADFGLSKEQLERLTERVVHHVTSGTKTLQRLFLVDDMVESLKFAFLFYVLTYVGAVFNGLTLLILGVISAFTFPLLYRQHQAQIDQYVGLVRNQLSNLRAKMLAKLPTAKAKAE